MFRLRRLTSFPPLLAAPWAALGLLSIASCSGGGKPPPAEQNSSPPKVQAQPGPAAPVTVPVQPERPAVAQPPAGVPAGWRTSTGKPFAERYGELKGCENCGWCCQTLCRGAQPSKEGLKQLQKKGFKTIICLRSWLGEDREDVERLGMIAVSIPMQADLRGSKPPTEVQIEQFFAIVLDPRHQPVYFHCAHGKDRTGTLAALYRMEVDGWTPAEAIEEMQAFGFNDIWKDLMEFVRNYQVKGYAKKHGQLK